MSERKGMGKSVVLAAWSSRTLSESFLIWGLSMSAWSVESGDAATRSSCEFVRMQYCKREVVAVVDAFANEDSTMDVWVPSPQCQIKRAL